jgi:5-bromo-4-chloroindolyl phosphate hydrolysis protein
MKVLRFLLSAIIGFAIFVMFFKGLRSSLVISVVAAVISFFGSMLMSSSPKKEKEKRSIVKPAPKQNKNPVPMPGDDEYVFEGMTRGEFRKIIVNGREQIKRIEDIGLKIMKHDVRVNILEICATANDIFDEFVKDPKDVKRARRFILYYLDTTERIVSKYYQLGKTPYLSDDAKKTLKNVENTLDLIKDTFRKQLKKLTENDVMDLDAEVKVLQNTIKQEGI